MHQRRFHKTVDVPQPATLISSVMQEHREVLDMVSSRLEAAFTSAFALCETCIDTGRKLLICGNGGSAADAQHFTSELVGRFEFNRIALPAIALTTDTSSLTALANDLGYEHVFSRQVESLGRPGDVLIAISTSGVSKNVRRAMIAARTREMKVLFLTGDNGERTADTADISIVIPSSRTARIQEMHMMFLHALAEALDYRYLDARSGDE